MATEYQERLAEALTELTHYPGLTGEVVGKAQQIAKAPRVFKLKEDKPETEVKEEEDAGDN